MAAQHEINTFQDILDVLEGDAALQKAFHKHITDVIRCDEDFRREMRKEILTEELLAVPVRLTRLEETVAEVKSDVAELKTDMAEVKSDVAELKTDMAEVKSDIAELKTTVSSLSGTVRRIAGEDYESMAVEPARRAIRDRLGATNASTIHGQPKAARLPINETLLSQAISDGLISPQEADRLEDADSIVRCEYADGHQAYGVTEISITVHDDDRTRAYYRAKILAAATGVQVVPFVVGQSEDPAGPGVPEVEFIEYAG